VQEPQELDGQRNSRHLVDVKEVRIRGALANLGYQVGPAPQAYRTASCLTRRRADSPAVEAALRRRPAALGFASPRCVSHTPRSWRSRNGRQATSMPAA